VKTKKEVDKKLIENRAVNRFMIALSIVSIVGFLGIISETLFNFILKDYIEALLMLILGIGLIIEVKLQRLKSIYSHGLTRDNFANIIVIIIGIFAIVAGIFSFPQIRVSNPSFVAIKGILSIIAIAIITIQTWFMKQK
jgi:hypothetical protein